MKCKYAIRGVLKVMSEEESSKVILFLRGRDETTITFSAEEICNKEVGDLIEIERSVIDEQARRREERKQESRRSATTICCVE